MATAEVSDFLVIGGGIAGLTYALEVASHGSVTVLFKRSSTDSSTSWAQGGIAAVSGSDDSVDLHVADTIDAGAGLCRPDVVDFVVREGTERVQELIKRGARFDRVQDGSYQLTTEGGHSRRRVLHRGDSTGWEIQRSLLEAVKSNSNIRLVTDVSAIDLITDPPLSAAASGPRTAYGAYVLVKPNTVIQYLARKILVATGGAGKVYLYTSNPDVATGDGIAMCYRAGARIANMEFFQFHPTCLYHERAKSFLISEALRGEGALLRRVNGERFIDDYDSRGELAPRDIVARAIDHQMKLHGEDYVLLDITHREAGFIQQRFPAIYQHCLTFGIDITTQPIPVVPAAHYCCGGVVSDAWGRTDIGNVFVAGETACTGLHGANRLASNSLLEGLVFGYRAARASIDEIDRTASLPTIPEWDPGSARDSDEEVVIAQTWDEIRRYMWNYVGIVRSNKRLQRALKRSKFVENEIKEYYWNFYVTPDLLELRNLSVVAGLVVESALKRRESRGLHYNVDFPATLDLAVDTVLRR